MTVRELTQTPERPCRNGAPRLARRALEILLETIRKENTVSPRQHKALAQILAGMARQATGQDIGRYAYGLPCGGGKTQGALALIVAARELGLDLTFAVATQQVEPLCEFKRQLIAHGIPEHDIGLWHSLPVNPARAEAEAGFASLPATPTDDDRPVLLLSQEKIRQGNTAVFNGKPRNLIIWDESLLATKARAMSIIEIQSACSLAEQYAPSLAPFLKRVTTAATAELDALRTNPRRSPKVFNSVLTHAEIIALRASLDSVHGPGAYVRLMRKTVGDLLHLLERPVSVAETGSGGTGDGVLRYDVLVPSELANIAILDASHSIRLLARADASTKDRTSPEMLEYRRYGNVSVRLVKLATGKQRMSKDAEASLPAAREVAAALAAIPTDGAVLIFTFKDSLRYLRRNLERLGVDLSQQITINGEEHHRVEFLTWGQETGRNDMRHCQHVIMAGVLRRDTLDIAASLTAQQQEPQPRRNSRATLAEVMLSETAHCVLQAMHRAACRLSDASGEAMRTSVLILAHGMDGLQRILAESLPAAKWTTSKPTASRRTGGVTSDVQAKIVQYLTGPDAPAQKVSTAALRKRLGVSLHKSVFSDALDTALIECRVQHHNQWRRAGRGIVRDGVQ